MITNVLKPRKFTIMDMSQFKSFCYVLFLIINLLTNLNFWVYWIQGDFLIIPNTVIFSLTTKVIHFLEDPRDKTAHIYEPTHLLN